MDFARRVLLAWCVVAITLTRASFDWEYEFSEQFERSPSRWPYIKNGTADMWPNCRLGTAQAPASVRLARTRHELQRIVNSWIDSNNYTITNDGVRIRLVPQDVEPAFTDPNTRRVSTLRYISVHVPSANTFGGSSADLELAFVHGVGGSRDTMSNPSAVLHVRAVAGFSDNTAYAIWINAIPTPPARDLLTGIVSSPSVAVVRSVLSVNAMFPPLNRDYVVFDGSEMRPPCREGVRHYVFQSALTVSYAQLAAIRSKLHVQPALANGWPPRAARASPSAVKKTRSVSTFDRYVQSREFVTMDAIPEYEAYTRDTIVSIIGLILGGMSALLSVIAFTIALCYPRVDAS
jgi:carbonic anhydrase